MTEKEIFDAACAAAIAAFHAAKPVPMVVYEADVLSGKPIAGGFRETVSDGVCGFAWVNIRPARGKFVSWLKKNGIGRRDSYAGGYTVNSGSFGSECSMSQSMTRKEDAARAFAKILSDNGVTAYAESRID